MTRLNQHIQPQFIHIRMTVNEYEYLLLSYNFTATIKQSIQGMILQLLDILEKMDCDKGVWMELILLLD